jgi:hypothetical protein
LTRLNEPDGLDGPMAPTGTETEPRGGLPHALVSEFARGCAAKRLRKAVGPCAVERIRARG